MTQPAANWESIARYLAGEASAQEAADVRRWLDEHRADAEFIAAVERLSAARRAPTVDVDAALRKVKARRGPARRPRWMRGTSWTTRLEILATAATILIVAGVFAYRAIEGSRVAPEVAYATGVGQRDSVRLDDGSVVLLGPASRIVVRERDVDLVGTAFFRVEHDARRPFTVRAAGAVIRDIGTEFTVDASQGTDSAVRVVVSEGSVALSRGQAAVTLERGDIGSVAGSGRVEAMRGAASPEDLAWTRGQLIFRDAPLSRVAMDLRRWYGVEVRVSDTTLRNRHFTGSFTNESRDRVLDVLALALGASFELRGDTAILHQTSRRR